MLPFTVDQFFAVFGSYNTAIWPAPLIAYALGFAALAFLVRPGTAADRITVAVLALMWFWTGAAYHWLSFAAINPAAKIFGASFILQAALFVYAGWKRQLVFGFVSGVRGAAGIALIIYAGVLYPLLGIWLGHHYPMLPMFGVTPCPVTIFTFGCLLLTKQPIPWWALVIPVLWSLIGGSAAFLLGVPQDWVLLFSGLGSLVLLMATGPSAHPRRVGERGQTG